MSDSDKYGLIGKLDERGESRARRLRRGLPPCRQLTPRKPRYPNGSPSASREGIMG